MKADYMVFDPSGNITALVIGDTYSQEEKIRINAAVMNADPRIEQLGFLSETACVLAMAGGEFCGNAARCAAYYYLRCKECTTSFIYVNGDRIAVGAEEDLVWADIPIKGYSIHAIDENAHIVSMRGITHFVLQSPDSMQYAPEALKEKAKQLMEHHGLDDEAVGVIFASKKNGMSEIKPVIWVKAVNTLVCENACGSGTVAAVMVEAFRNKTSAVRKVLQPSGEYLEADIRFNGEEIEQAVLSGKILADRVLRSIVI